MDAVHLLVASGHSMASILVDSQPGLPYQGWTLPQFEGFLRVAARERLNAFSMDVRSTMMAIAAALSKDGNKAVEASLKRLSAQGQQ